MWNKILEINWRARFSDDFMDEPIEGTNGATRGKMNNINRWIKMWLSAIEAPLFGAAIMAILVMGERNFFSPQMRYQTEPIASIGKCLSQRRGNYTRLIFPIYRAVGTDCWHRSRCAWLPVRRFGENAGQN